MFDQLVNEAASRFNLSTTNVSALVRGLLSLITSERTGGAEGFVDQFRRAGLGDVITSWYGGKEGKAITAPQLESALGASALDKLAGLGGLARTTATTAIAFLLPRIIGRLTPNGILPSNSSLLSQISSYVDRPSVATVERPAAVIERRDAGPDWRRWLPWAAAAAIALIGLLWLRAPAGTVDSQLTVTNRDGKVTYSGVVHDESTQTAIVDALRTTFGASNVDGNLRIDPNVKRVAWLPHLGDLVAALKTPGAEFSLTGDTVNLGGWLSVADRQALTDKLHDVFGAQATIGSLGDPATEAVRAARDKALSALGAIGTSGVSSDALVQAMNLAIINFPTGSSAIPADSMEIIGTSAEALKRAPASSKIEIGGHTDNTGDPSRNLALSQARADAVKAALVSAGVSSSMLTAKGYGDTRPRASNDTEYGRFQNRRIEYTDVTNR